MPALHAVLSAALVAACFALAPHAAHAATPPDAPARDPARNEGAARPDAGAVSPAPARKPRRSNRCNTPAINCILSEYQAAGSSCWCVTPFGPSYGRVP